MGEAGKPRRSGGLMSTFRRGTGAESPRRTGGFKIKSRTPSGFQVESHRPRHTNRKPAFQRCSEPVCGRRPEEDAILKRRFGNEQSLRLGIASVPRWFCGQWTYYRVIVEVLFGLDVIFRRCESEPLGGPEDDLCAYLRSILRASRPRVGWSRPPGIQSSTCRIVEWLVSHLVQRHKIRQ